MLKTLVRQVSGENILPSLNSVDTKLVLTEVFKKENKLKFLILQLKSKTLEIELEKTGQQILKNIKENNLSFSKALAQLKNLPKTCEHNLIFGKIINFENKAKLQLFATHSSKIYLYKNQKIHSFLIKKNGINGELTAQDKLILGSERFWQTVSNNNLEKAFKDKNTSNFLQKIISNQPGFTRAICVEFDQRKQSKLVKLALQKIDSFSRKIFKSSPKKSIKIKPQILSRKKKIFISKKRKYALSLALIFLLILTTSIGTGIYKRKQFEQKQLEKKLVETLTYKLDQAASLKNLNPARAKTLLGEAKLSLDEYSQETKLPSEEITNLENQVIKAYEQVAGQNIIRDPQVFYDLTLLKDNFRPNQVALSEEELLLLDQESQTLALLNIDTKASQIIAGQDLILPKSKLASIPAWAFLYSGGKLQIIDKYEKEQIKSFRLEKTKVDQMIGYGNNAYILDISAGQVWRFRGVKNDLSKAEKFFLYDQDLIGATSMAIDGSIWLLYESGGVEKYTGGIKDAFYPNFGLDEPLDRPQKIFTDENQDNLYILDKKNSRVVVISKQGEFVAEYSWDKIEEVEDMVVAEQIGRILLLLNGKIYGIEIR
jgi:hypothetical protein